jgi:hypothetical protein
MLALEYLFNKRFTGLVQKRPFLGNSTDDVRALAGEVLGQPAKRHRRPIVSPWVFEGGGIMKPGLLKTDN